MTEREEAEVRAALIGVVLTTDEVAEDFLAAVRSMDLHIAKLPRDLPPGLEPAVKLGF
ncbi:MAG: hypothetical protein ACOVVK_11795 [Elsteraceae bacterium]